MNIFKNIAEEEAKHVGYETQGKDILIDSNGESKIYQYLKKNPIIEKMKIFNKGSNLPILIYFSPKKHSDSGKVVLGDDFSVLIDRSSHKVLWSLRGK